MDRNKSLVKNIFIFAIGNVGSKMLQFFFLSFYTRVLSSEQYGTVDILQSISTLLLPILSLTIFDAVFRFAMDGVTKKEDAFSVGMTTVSAGTVVLLLCGAILPSFFGYRSYIWLIILYTIAQMFRSVTSQYIRAIGQVKLFTVDNMFQTLMILLCNILFLVVFHWGIEGYILGYIVGNFCSFFFVFLVQKLWRDIKFRGIGKDLYSAMFRFSVPLIPNAVCWWLTTMIGRLMVTAYLGADANGLFAVAFKVPTIVTILVGIFIQAWQISANTECESKDFQEYNSQIFNILQVLTFLLSSFLVLVSKLLVMILDKSYYNAWEYIPPMLVGICFYTFAQFLGALYTASKKTVMAFVTNFVTAIVNIVGNVVLLPKFGVMGAALSLAISYLVFWLFRLVDTRHLVKMKYQTKSILVNLVLTTAIAVIVTFSPKFWILWGVLLFVVLCLVNVRVIKDLIVEAFNMLQSMFRLKRGQ